MKRAPATSRRPPAWNGSWLVLFCEWRRWRNLGFSRSSALLILLSSLHRLHGSPGVPSPGSGA